MNDWSPPQSPLRIGYADNFWQEFQPDPTRVETSGLLYGRADGNSIQLVSFRNRADEKAIGVYFVRSRGEIFLTESNVRAFEKLSATVGLVIAGEKAGFFVRDAEGALQSVRSYQEVTIPRLSPNRSKAMRVAGVVLAAVLPVAALAYWQTTKTDRLPHLVIRERGELLTITWKPAGRGELKISEGGLKTTIPVVAGQSHASYIRHGEADVDVVLTLADKPALLRGALF